MRHPHADEHYETDERRDAEVDKDRVLARDGL
jgi:hypothetical protein